MRKLIVLGIILTSFMMVMCSCGSGSNSSNENTTTTKEEVRDTVQGFWYDESNDILLSIDKENGYLAAWDVYACNVDESEQTITIAGYATDDSDCVYSYQFVNGKLLLNTDSEAAHHETITFIPDEEEGDAISPKKTVDGEWSDGETTMSIENGSGFMTRLGSDFLCTYDKEKGIMTIDGFSYDDTAIDYKVTFVNGRLVLSAPENQRLTAFEKTFVMIYPDELAKIEEKEDAKKESTTEEETKGAGPLKGGKTLSENYYVIGEDIDPGIYDFAPAENEIYFSASVYDSKKYYDESPDSGNYESDNTDYLDHSKDYYGETIEKGISLKTGNVLFVDYPGLQYRKQ